jgi:Uri superfamily endonuclease
VGPGRRDAAGLPAAPGAYLLLIALAEPLELEIRSLGHATLAPGRYLYAGSARGPGGIRARVSRHFRKEKARHWHVDHLTAVAAELTAFPVPDGSECALVEAVLADGWRTALPGFGSSDCRRCAGHLLAPR